MRKILGLVLLSFALMSSSAGAILAQDVEMAFSEEKLRELGFPVVQVQVGEDGIDAPSSLHEGIYLIELQPTEDYSVYMNIVIPPNDLGSDELREQALMAARDDIVLPGWTFLGGSNTFGVGVPTVFAIYLPAGEYAIAASYYLEEGEEIMDLAPLTVTGAATPVSDASPHASPAAPGRPQADVVLEMTDELEFIITPDPVPAGAQLWEFTNSGSQRHHHVVMYSVPEGTTAGDIADGFKPLLEGDEPAEDSIVMKMMPMGYAAIQSGGMTTWNGFDLEPGTYAVICFISDSESPEDWQPHLMDGMITVFVVE
jgi:hypothetical protein